MKLPHISVCVCTFKRPALLSQLLGRLNEQLTEDLFTYSVVVADNDAKQSAQPAVTAAAAGSRMPLRYCCEPQQNIALARNRALANAEGEFIAFIDDDELPVAEWLLQLFTTLATRGADGVLGPVKPQFEHEPARWVTAGRFFERPMYDTGYKLKYTEARSGNVLFRREILKDLSVPFNAEFATAGEDVDFFRRLMEKGRTFVWCSDAVVYEVVPRSRSTLQYLLKRALLRGSNFPKHPRDRFKNAAKSLVAVPCYTLVLPIAALFGPHVFVRYLIKFSDHASRLLAFVGLSVRTERET